MADDLLVGEADDETIFRGITVVLELGKILVIRFGIRTILLWTA